MLKDTWADNVDQYHAADQNAVADAINAISARLDVCVLDHGADPTGVADSTTAFRNAIAALPINGGWVYAPTGSYKISGTLNLNQFQRIRGDGKGITVINYVGTGAAILAANKNSGGVTANTTPIGLVGLTLNGSSSGTGAKGLQIGNLYGSVFEDLEIRAFLTTGGAGIYAYNGGPGIPACERNFWSAIELNFNKTAIIFDTGSFDYSEYSFLIEANYNQNGITLQNNAVLYGTRLCVRGNFATSPNSSTPNTGYVIGIDVGSSTGASQIQAADIDLSVETDGSGVAHTSIVTGTSLNTVFAGCGVLDFVTPIAGTTPFQNASIYPGTSFGFSGFINEPALGQMRNGDAIAFQGGTAYSYAGGAPTTLGSSVALNPSTADFQEFTLPNTSATVVGFTGAPFRRVRRLELLLHQPASGSTCVVTWPSGIKWAGASGGALSTVNGRTDRVRLTYYPSQNHWYGEITLNFA